MKYAHLLRKILGNRGEHAAAEFLRLQGLIILAQNFRHHPYEIDLIARDNRVLVFVEVRVRSANTLVKAEYSLGAKKRLSLRRGASAYLRRHPADFAELRFDLIAGNGGEWQWFRGFYC